MGVQYWRLTIVYEREYRMGFVLTSIARHVHRLQLLGELSRPHGSSPLPTAHYELRVRLPLCARVRADEFTSIHSRCK